MPREVLSSYKAARYNPQTGRLFVRWPDDPSAPPEYRGKTFPSHRPITENDVLLTITYDAPVLDQHGRYVHPGNVYQAALLENAERDAERSSESEQLNDCGPSQ